LLELQARGNQITDIEFLSLYGENLKFLQKADFSTNKITSIPSLRCPLIYSLNVDENEIASVDLFGNKSLRLLTMNKNKMISCKGMNNLEALEELSMIENELTSLDGLSDLPKLTKLNLTGNKLESLDTLQSFPELRELTLDGNPVAKI
jgi:protein phosphatase 1 regulatory subunit 7